MKENIKANGGSTTKDNYEIYKADMQLLGNYAAADTDLTLRVMTYYLPILKEQELWDFFFVDEVMPLYKTVTIQMEEKGTELDMELIQKTKNDITIELAKLEQEIISDLMTIPAAKQWVMFKATKSFPPKKRGNYAERLKNYESPENPDGVARFLSTGDPADLDTRDAVKISLDMWKEKEGNYLNISSKQQLADIVFKYMKIKPMSQTRKGTDQFNDDMIEHLSKDHSWAAKLRDYNKLTKINSAYIDRFLDGNENGRYKVYIDPYAANNSANQYYVVGYKGSSPYDAGLFYCPYVPLQMVRAVGENSFQPKIGFKTRYGIVANPFAEGTNAGLGRLEANTNRYYRRVRVDNLM